MQEWSAEETTSYIPITYMLKVESQKGIITIQQSITEQHKNLVILRKPCAQTYNQIPLLVVHITSYIDLVHVYVNMGCNMYSV